MLTGKYYIGHSAHLNYPFGKISGPKLHWFKCGQLFGKVIQLQLQVLSWLTSIKTKNTEIS